MKKAWCVITIASKVKVKIDKEDLARVEKYTWRVTKGSTGRPRVVTSIRGPDGPRSITLGRYLLKPAKNKQVYPRRFNDGLDYRKSNLVICTLKERQRLLAKRRAKTSSKYKGVSYAQGQSSWKAGIEVNGKSINLGAFKNEKDAAMAYNKAALKYFGKIAYQNEITKNPKRKYDR